MHKILACSCSNIDVYNIIDGRVLLWDILIIRLLPSWPDRTHT